MKNQLKENGKRYDYNQKNIEYHLCNPKLTMQTRHSQKFQNLQSEDLNYNYTLLRYK